MTQHVQAEAIEKSSIADILRAHHAHMLSNMNSEGLSKLHPQNLKFFNQSSPNGKMANNDDVVSDDGKMEQNEFIKAFTKVSIKDTTVSDGNDSESSSFSVIISENKVKNNNF